MQHDNTNHWRDDTDSGNDCAVPSRMACEPREEERGDERDHAGRNSEEGGDAGGVAEGFYASDGRIIVRQSENRCSVIIQGGAEAY